MRKKLLCIVIAVMLVFSFAGVAMAAAPAPENIIKTNEPLPEGQELCIIATYSPEDAQYQMFEENLADNEKIFKVVELAVYDENTGKYLDDETSFWGTTYTFSLGGGSSAGCTYKVLHNGAGSGGTEDAGSADAVSTDSGFGLFAVVEVSPVPYSLQEVTCSPLEDKQHVYMSEEYGKDSAQWEEFAEYIEKNKLSANIEHVLYLELWDEDSGWVANSSIGETQYTVTMPSEYAGYTVLYQSSQTGGIISLGTGNTFTTDGGLGLFAFVKTDENKETPVQPEDTNNTENNKTSPKTTDNTADPTIWILLAVIFALALPIAIYKTRKVEK